MEEYSNYLQENTTKLVVNLGPDEKQGDDSTKLGVNQSANVRQFSKSIPRKGATPLDAKPVRYSDLVGSRTKGGMMSP